MISTATSSRVQIRPFTNPYTLLVLVGLGLLGGYFLIRLQSDDRGLYNLYLLSLLQLTPFIICITRRHYDYLGLILVNHFLTYSIGRYNHVMNVTRLGRFFPENISAFNQYMFCLMIIASVYYICRSFLFFRFAESEKYQVLSLKPLYYFLLIGYIVLFPVMSDYIPASWLAMHFISVNADLVLLFSSRCPQMPRISVYSRGIALIVCMYYFLKFGSLGMLLNYIGLAFVSACLQHKYKNLFAVAILLSIGLFIQSVKYNFRTVIFENRSLPMAERVSLLAELIAVDVGVSENPNENADENNMDQPDDEEEIDVFSRSLFHSFDRINDESLERVLTMTPSKVPFWNGESYQSVPFMFIPRPLWPNKPTRHFWNKFGRTYGYLLSDDFQTSVAISFLAEGYMNYGFAGLYGIAILFGFLVAFAERLSYYIVGGYFYFSFIVFLMPLLHYSSDMGSMVHALVIFAVTLYFLRPQIKKVAQKDDYS